MKIIFLLSFLIVATSFTQNNNEIIRIEFSSLTRGHQESTVITPDSIKFSINAQKPAAKYLEKKQWTAILKSLQDVNPSSIGELKSPTMKRAYDGARQSTITLTTSSQSFSHTFDDENPHEKLKALMKIILEQKKKNFTK